MTSEDETTAGQGGGGKPSARERRDAREEASERVPRFAVDRVRGIEGPAILDGAFDGDPPAGNAAGLIAGALHDFDEDELTHAELRKRVEKFLERSETTTQEASR